MTDHLSELSDLSATVDRTDTTLPAPAVQNHAANLTVLPGGDLGCVWFGGTQEGVADICVWFSRLTPGATTWTDPIRLSDDPARSEQNPLLFPAPSGALWLLHTAQRGGDQDTAEVRLRVSHDNGVTWDEPRTLFPATPGTGGVFVRQPPVLLPTGRLLVPVFRCRTTPGEKWSGDLDTSAVMISGDQGGTWREQPVPGSTGLVHMNVHPLPDSSLLALFRSRRADAVHRSVSLDDGDTWSEPQPLDLPNNNSSIQYLPLTDGRLALVYNHSSAADATARRVSLYDEIDDSGALGDSGGEAAHATPTAARRDVATPTASTALAAAPGAFWGAPRAPLSLALSSDAGLTWPLRTDLVTGDGHCLTNNSRDGLNRELSYPSIAQTPDGAVHIAYTHHRKVIRHIRLVLR
ncbi:sialidase family protein [Streptomyces griseiscabiei]|uniref:Exo-alpha-sialidase n=1 Tax=Streptomyces griseiscabiei TaxID=2993540 RepID=A0ABU4L1X4_9ACTN|nr:exo-alpha-sialidase [Streptomyces griseiscabiei]MBZ3905973.1 exo-alpha-sialidase [Streptomyces griseiscabiei]MDX2909603.1 exo-alpha-sialidase [Streptomyces griseiscabiei]